MLNKKPDQQLKIHIDPTSCGSCILKEKYCEEFTDVGYDIQCDDRTHFELSNRTSLEDFVEKVETLLNVEKAHA